MIAKEDYVRIFTIKKRTKIVDDEDEDNDEEEEEEEEDTNEAVFSNLFVL